MRRAATPRVLPLADTDAEDPLDAAKSPWARAARSAVRERRATRSARVLEHSSVGDPRAYFRARRPKNFRPHDRARLALGRHERHRDAGGKIARSGHAVQPARAVLRAQRHLHAQSRTRAEVRRSETRVPDGGCRPSRGVRRPPRPSSPDPLTVLPARLCVSVPNRVAHQVEESQQGVAGRARAPDADVSRQEMDQFEEFWACSSGAGTGRTNGERRPRRRKDGCGLFFKTGAGARPGGGRVQRRGVRAELRKRRGGPKKTTRRAEDARATKSCSSLGARSARNDDSETAPKLPETQDARGRWHLAMFGRNARRDRGGERRRRPEDDEKRNRSWWLDAPVLGPRLPRREAAASSACSRRLGGSFARFSLPTPGSVPPETPGTPYAVPGGAKRAAP